MNLHLVVMELLFGAPCEGYHEGNHTENGHAERSLVQAPFWPTFERNAGIAQLVEQLICNQQVIGSSPIAG